MGELSDRELADLPVELINQLSAPLKQRAVSLMAKLGLRPVFRGSQGNFRIAGFRVPTPTNNGTEHD